MKMKGILFRNISLSVDHQPKRSPLPKCIVVDHIDAIDWALYQSTTSNKIVLYLDDLDVFSEALRAIRIDPNQLNNSGVVEGPSAVIFSGFPVKLIIDFSRIPPEKAPALNCFFDDPPTYVGRRLGPRVDVEAVLPKSMIFDYFPADCYSRLANVVEVTATDGIRPRRPIQTVGINDIPADAVQIDLFETPDWTSAVFGRPTLGINGELNYVDSPWVSRLRRGDLTVPVVFKNPPKLGDKWVGGFEFFLHRLVNGLGHIDVNGQLIPCCPASVMICDTYQDVDPALLNPKLSADLMPKLRVPINRHTVSSLFGGLVVDASGNIQMSAGILDSFKFVGAIFEVSGDVRASDRKRLEAWVADQNRNSSGVVFLIRPRMDKQKKPTRIQSIPDPSIVIDISAFTREDDLLGHLEIRSFSGREFCYRPGIIEQSLSAGTPVVLRGLDANPRLRSALSSLLIDRPFLFSNGKIIRYAHQSVIAIDAMTQQPTPFTESPEPVSEDKDQILIARVRRHPIVLIEGPPGCGKTYWGEFVGKELCGQTWSVSIGPDSDPDFLLGYRKKNPDSDQLSYAYGPIMEWAKFRPTSDDQFPTLIINEANLAPSGFWNFLNGLMMTPPQLGLGGPDGFFVEVNPNHRVILTQNPVAIGGRQRHPVLDQLAHRLFFEADTPLQTKTLVAQILSDRQVVYSDETVELIMNQMPDSPTLRDYMDGAEQYAFNQQTSDNDSFLTQLQAKYPEFDFKNSSTQALAITVHQRLRLAAVPGFLGKRGMLIEGPPGRGKDSVIDRVVQFLYPDPSVRPVRRITCTLGSDYHYMVESIRLAKQDGAIIAISELNLLPTNVAEGLLNDALTGHHHPHFFLFITVNSGREPFSVAFKSRLVCHVVPDYTPDDLLQLLTCKGTDPMLARRLVDAHLRITHRARTIKTAPVPTLRELLSAVMMDIEGLTEPSFYTRVDRAYGLHLIRLKLSSYRLIDGTDQKQIPSLQNSEPNDNISHGDNNFSEESNQYETVSKDLDGSPKYNNNQLNKLVKEPNNGLSKNPKLELPWQLKNTSLESSQSNMQPLQADKHNQVLNQTGKEFAGNQSNSNAAPGNLSSECENAKFPSLPPKSLLDEMDVFYGPLSATTKDVDASRSYFIVTGDPNEERRIKRECRITVYTDIDESCYLRNSISTIHSFNPKRLHSSVVARTNYEAIGNVTIPSGSGLLALPSLSPNEQLTDYYVESGEDLLFFKDFELGVIYAKQIHSEVTVQYKLSLPIEDQYRYYERSELICGLFQEPPEVNPPHIPGQLKQALREIKIENIVNLSSNDPYITKIDRLSAYCRNFTQGKIPDKIDTRISKNIENSYDQSTFKYLNLILQRMGVCRHRSWVFLALAGYFGVTARLANNHIHTLVEVKVSHKFGGDPYWIKIELSDWGYSSVPILDSNDHKQLINCLKDWVRFFQKAKGKLRPFYNQSYLFKSEVQISSLQGLAHLRDTVIDSNPCAKIFQDYCKYMIDNFYLSPKDLSFDFPENFETVFVDTVISAIQSWSNFGDSHAIDTCVDAASFFYNLSRRLFENEYRRNELKQLIISFFTNLVDASLSWTNNETGVIKAMDAIFSQGEPYIISEDFPQIRSRAFKLYQTSAYSKLFEERIGKKYFKSLSLRENAPSLFNAKISYCLNHIFNSGCVSKDQYQVWLDIQVALIATSTNTVEGSPTLRTIYDINCQYFDLNIDALSVDTVKAIISIFKSPLSNKSISIFLDPLVAKLFNELIRQNGKYSPLVPLTDHQIQLLAEIKDAFQFANMEMPVEIDEDLNSRITRASRLKIQPEFNDNYWGNVSFEPESEENIIEPWLKTTKQCANSQSIITDEQRDEMAARFTKFIAAQYSEKNRILNAIATYKMIAFAKCKNQCIFNDSFSHWISVIFELKFSFPTPSDLAISVTKRAYTEMLFAKPDKSDVPIDYLLSDVQYETATKLMALIFRNLDLSDTYSQLKEVIPFRGDGFSPRKLLFLWVDPAQNSSPTTQCINTLIKQVPELLFRDHQGAMCLDFERPRYSRLNHDQTQAFLLFIHTIFPNLWKRGGIQQAVLKNIIHDFLEYGFESKTIKLDDLSTLLRLLPEYQLTHKSELEKLAFFIACSICLDEVDYFKNLRSWSESDVAIFLNLIFVKSKEITTGVDELVNILESALRVHPASIVVWNNVNNILCMNRRWDPVIPNSLETVLFDYLDRVLDYKPTQSISTFDKKYSWTPGPTIDPGRFLIGQPCYIHQVPVHQPKKYIIVQLNPTYSRREGELDQHLNQIWGGYLKSREIESISIIVVSAWGTKHPQSKNDLIAVVNAIKNQMSETDYVATLNEKYLRNRFPGCEIEIL